METHIFYFYLVSPLRDLISDPPIFLSFLTSGLGVALPGQTPDSTRYWVWYIYNIYFFELKGSAKYTILHIFGVYQKYRDKDDIKFYQQAVFVLRNSRESSKIGQKRDFYEYNTR